MNKVKPNQYYWIFYILGALIICGAIFFAPLWDDLSSLHEDWHIPWRYFYVAALKVMVSTLLVVYIIMLIIPKLKEDTPKEHKIANIVELVFIASIVIICLIEIIININFLNICMIGGLVLFIHGAFEIINSYFSDDGERYSFYYLIINIFCVALASVIFYVGILHPNIDKIISYVFCGLLIISGVLCIIYAVFANPKKVVKRKNIVIDGVKMSASEIEQNHNIVINVFKDNSDFDENEVIMDDVKFEER